MRTKPEALLQRQVVDALQILGYKVFETGKTRTKVRCTKCGAYSYATGYQGNTPGLPDLYIHSSHHLWGSKAVAIELKAVKGKTSDIQQEIADAGYTTICRSVREVLDVVIKVETDLNNWITLDRITRFREANDGLLEAKY
jgi:hypothetical protein